MSKELDTDKDPDHQPDLTRRHLGVSLLAVLGGGLGVVKTAAAFPFSSNRAEKKKIKGIKDNSGSADGAIITVTDANPPRTGSSAFPAPAPDQMFEQYGYKGLCFNVDDIINTESVVVDGVSVIIEARRIQRGTVLTTTNNNSGTIAENQSNKTINFKQAFLKELNINVGAEVKYDLVYNFGTGSEMAVNVGRVFGEFEFDNRW